MRKVFATSLILVCCSFLYGQVDDYYYEEIEIDPRDSAMIAQLYKNDTVPTWEFGIHGGHVFMIGNVDYLPGFSTGIHFRRALDYVFSLRVDAMYSNVRGEDKADARSYDTDWISTSLLGIVTLNNLKWEGERRKANLYAMGGVGLNYFQSDVKKLDSPDFEIEGKVAWHGEFGIGISLRINKLLNVGIEHKIVSGFGKRADLLDGFETIASNSNRKTFPDIMHYSNFRINFNISKNALEEEPKYWMNPMDGIHSELDSIKNILAKLEDGDGDGVIDLVDREPNSAAGAYVDTKGVTRDGDLDGIPDFLDRQPYSPPGVPIDAYGVAKEKTKTERENVRAIVQEEIAKIEFPQLPPPVIETKTSNWYLPNVYFDAGSTEISSLDYGTLLTVSKVMRDNPEEKFVIAGNTDPSGSEKANNRLSYKRASSVVNQLVKFGVPRSQLILLWKGEQNTLKDGLHQVNRRVEIRRAEGEIEMAPPQD
jgi:outer membrane protein OmpA-like peptidoglycan-associated protein